MKQTPRVLRAGLAVLAAGALLFGATRLPSSLWAKLGRTLAVASVSLQQAENAAERLSANLTRPTAHAAGDSTTLPDAPPNGAEQQPLTEPTAEQNDTSLTPPAQNGSGGRVVEQVVSGGDTVAGITVKNKSGVAADVAAALTASLPFSIEVGTDEPQVLIYHTHTTEGYMPYYTGYYNAGDVPRNDTYQNTVVAVGDALEAELTAAGIAVIHDTTIYDYPNYRGSYERSVVTMEEMLKRYPSIKVTLDIHRDGLMVNSTDMLKPTVTVEGQKAAQLMLVCGVLSTEALPHPAWQKNLSFAAKLQQALESRHPSLCRPLSLTGARYNQYVTTGSLLIEVGSEGNTLEEATYSAHLLGQTLVEMWS